MPHAAGTVKYKFEAEFTNLGGKTGNGYSGTGSELDWIVDCEDGTSSGQVISYMYRMGCSVNFIIVSDKTVNNAQLTLCLGGEYMDLDINPNNFQVRVDTKIQTEDLVGEDSAIGAWDAYFLNYRNTTETDGYYVCNGQNAYECGKIEIKAADTASPSMFKEYKVTTTLRLRKGVNCISLITNNSEAGPGTMLSHAPCIDYIAIETDAQLGMYDKMSNGGNINNACTIMA